MISTDIKKYCTLDRWENSMFFGNEENAEIGDRHSVEYWQRDRIQQTESNASEVRD